MVSSNRGPGTRAADTRRAQRPNAQDASQEQDTRLTMQRGVSQLLFNYLPKRTVDWEDGLAIVELQSINFSAIWEEERAATLLTEVANLFDRWRARGGSIDRQFPDPRHDRARFAVGVPESITASVLHTALVCPRCSLLTFPRKNELTRLQSGQFRCQRCQGRGLRQIPFVFVHGCGELLPITEWLPGIRRNDNRDWEEVNRPIRCSRCGTEGILELLLRSERVKDMRVNCANCHTELPDRLSANCHRCLHDYVTGRTAERATPNSTTRPAGDTLVARIAMRLSRYSASDTYYPQTLSMLRLDRPAVVRLTDDEQTMLRRMLPNETRQTNTGSVSDVLTSLATRLRQAEAASDQEEIRRIQELILRVVSPSQGEPPISEPFPLAALASDVEQSVQEAIAFRETVNMRPAITVAQQFGNLTPTSVNRIEELRLSLGLRNMLLVEDLPVITATFGYTRRSFEPTYDELSATNLPTQIRAFPSLERFAAQRLGRPDLVGTIPIPAREGEHEGLFLSLEPSRVLRWLEINGIPLPPSDLPPVPRMLSVLESVDRYYDNIWRLSMRRMIFGLVHSLSHLAMRAISRFAGVERTSLGEYIFLPLLGTVIFDNSSAFRLGGIETLVRNQLHAFLNDLAERSTECLYDTACIDQKGACHGCIHSPEICCRVFNHGLSRAFLIGGHAPWTDIASNVRIQGYWNMGTV